MMNVMLLLALAAAPAGSYNAGNAHYSAGKYGEAISAYRQALEQADHPHLRYNLGNAYFKDGRLGMAVVQYRRARAMAPRDWDIASNLEFIRSYRIDKLPTQAGPLEAFLARAFTRFSGREASLYAGLCFLLAAALVSLRLALERRWIILASIPAMLAFTYFLAVSQTWQAERRSNPGAVAAREVSALSGPGEEFKEILLLHDGTEVRIREARGGYLLVQLPGGIGGWVPEGAVERIY
jgi:tetratricopeptide (TPR) repeat protein